MAFWTFSDLQFPLGSLDLSVLSCFQVTLTQAAIYSCGNYAHACISWRGHLDWPRLQPQSSGVLQKREAWEKAHQKSISSRAVISEYPQPTSLGECMVSLCLLAQHMHNTRGRCQGSGQLPSRAWPAAPHQLFKLLLNVPACALSILVQGACDFMRAGLSWRPGLPGATAIDWQH